ncbi:MAG: hypothetical protein K8F91_07655, partial [Candidatus Obscuribacterales bacterium]|nr:hypothetical protein [Candidatus Obscuribacterales bacterium]
MTSTTSQPDVLDMGTPQRMVGHTGYTKHAGGGECPSCHNVFNSLMPDGKCAGCSQVTLSGEPLGKPVSDPCCKDK